MKKTDFVSFRQIDWKDGFWKNRCELNQTVSVQNVQKRFEETARFDAVRFNYLKNGKKLHIFYDSDAAKWIESVAYLLQKDRARFASEEAFVDELVDCMERAQREDGYLNSFHQQITPMDIFQIRGNHELYCLGHMIEAAVEYDRATGKGTLLAIVERYCDYVERVFLLEKSAAFETPGHEEIELALFKLYRYTGKEKYRTMAEHFLNRRGCKEDEQLIHNNREYAQDDHPIREFTEANGHSVRALYLYSGMADMAYETGDAEIKAALDRLWEDMVTRKMYITGGVGSTYRGESFTVAYDLPNHTAYSESCCAIAFLMLAARMRRLERNARYGHLVERVLYNSLLSSSTLDGKGFFYENPLEIALEERDREVANEPSKRERLPITTRLEVFRCSCCPPNITRAFARLGDWICYDEDGYACVEQWMASEVQSAYGTLTLEGELAKTGVMTVSCENYKADRIMIRIPEWCRRMTVTSDGNEVSYERDEVGYAVVSVGASFRLTFDFHIAPTFVSANPKVRADVGRMALTYGPVVYCLEGVDNGSRLNRLSVSPDAVRSAKLYEDFHGLLSVELEGFCDKDQTALYFDAAEAELLPKQLKFIPYFSFANRGETDMLVWVRRA
ncbi:MAG: glycoside hydrolase family 127 protein [Clostridia bacterium]|nr:glycoside hydrolase family 127 protein [Clostridia bacterium]